MSEIFFGSAGVTPRAPGKSAWSPAFRPQEDQQPNGGLHFGAQRKIFANFASLRLCENPLPRGRVLAKSQRRKVRKGPCGKPEPCLSRRLEIVVNLNTQMQSVVKAGLKAPFNFPGFR